MTVLRKIDTSFQLGFAAISAFKCRSHIFNHHYPHNSDDEPHCDAVCFMVHKLGSPHFLNRLTLTAWAARSYSDCRAIEDRRLD